MKQSSTSIRIGLRPILVVVFFSVAVSSIAQVGEVLPHASTQSDIKVAMPAQNVPPCASTPSNPAVGHASSQSNSQANPVAHSVTLSWNASVPRSNSKQDAILGYHVY